MGRVPKGPTKSRSVAIAAAVLWIKERGWGRMTRSKECGEEKRGKVKGQPVLQEFELWTFP